jgi:hypothetical protein
MNPARRAEGVAVVPTTGAPSAGRERDHPTGRGHGMSGPAPPT